MQKILIVDDDQYIREVYEEVLIEAGYSVETAADGKDGLEKISEGGYDLILLDIMMPYLDGLGILAKIKESKTKKKNGPIMILTNLAYDQIAEETMEAGAKYCYNKADFNPDELLLKIKEILK